MVKKKRFLLSIFIILLCIPVIIYHTHKDLPEGISYAGEIHQVTEEDAVFLYDLTFESDGELKHEQQIFERAWNLISEAEDFIIVDMFLFNGYYDEDIPFPDLSSKLAGLLIERKEENPDMPIIFISDEVNTTYGSHASPEFEAMKAAGIPVVMSEMESLRDSNPLYSSVWRIFLQWFGQEGTGWLPNPFAAEAPNVTLRSYLKLLNVKANHRKLIATDKGALIPSANPHDASGFHSNTAFEVRGNILQDIIESEKAVADYSGEHIDFPQYQKREQGGDLELQLLTEGKILQSLLETIRNASSESEIWIGMFYLADQEVITELLNASDRGADIRLVLDPNENAFGQQKIGMPNRPVASELIENSEGNIDIRWYNTEFEQYHTKMMYIRDGADAVVISGSANFTRRNLDDLNLENNIKLEGPAEAKPFQDVQSYFERIWNNEDGIFTLPLETYKEEQIAPFKRTLYALQRFFRFTTY
nr:phospholipase D family protein [Metabacillus lacus]